MNQQWLVNNPWANSVAEGRDKRIVGGVPIEPIKMTQFIVWTRNNLRSIAAKGIDVDKLVQMTGKNQQERVLTCGDRNGKSFIRRDGVASNFIIVVREVNNTLELLSYVLHLEAPKDHAVGPQFLRWEYSPTRKENVSAVREPLAHLHPGHDHVRLPCAVLSPKELITVFLTLELWH